MAESCAYRVAMLVAVGTSGLRVEHHMAHVRAKSPCGGVRSILPRCRMGMRSVFVARSICSANDNSSSSFGARMEESVRKTVSENAAVVYSKTWCSYSMEVKSLFKRLGFQPLVIELDELGPQGPQLQKVLERITGQFTVPNVFIGGIHIGGCTDTVKLHQKGELTPLLSKATSPPA